MKCLICEDEWPDEEGGLESFVDHMRVNHPDQYEEPDRWPDGQLVVIDDTLEPEDFR
jgi:hypothetical protein